MLVLFFFYEILFCLIILNKINFQLCILMDNILYYNIGLINFIIFYYINFSVSCICFRVMLLECVYYRFIICRGK